MDFSINYGGDRQWRQEFRTMAGWQSAQIGGGDNNTPKNQS